MSSAEKKEEDSKPTLVDGKYKHNDPDSLMRDIGSLLFSEILSDVVFVVSGERIHAHKFVLAARSQVFRTMFTSGDNNTSPQQTIVIDELKAEEPKKEEGDEKKKKKKGGGGGGGGGGVLSSLAALLGASSSAPPSTASVFRALLRFLYSGSVDITAPIVEPLIRLSTTYGINDAKKACDRFVLASLTTDNVASTLKLAERYGLPETTRACGDLIAVDLAKLFESADFIRGASEELMVSIVQSDMCGCTEEELFSACLKWAKTHLILEGKDDTTDNIRTALQRIVPHIRLPQMASLFMFETAGTSQLFDQTALLQAAKYRLFVAENAKADEMQEFKGVQYRGREGAAGSTLIPIFRQGTACTHASSPSWSHSATSVDAVQFNVEKCKSGKPKLAAIGIFLNATTATITFRLMDGATVLLEIKKEFPATGTAPNDPVQLKFPKPFVLTLKKNYTLYQTLATSSTTWSITGGKAKVEHAASGLAVNFSAASSSGNGTSVSEGQFPVLYFC